MSNPVILFDGECLLCDRVVRFILANDPHGVFRFAPLHSQSARRLLANAVGETSSGETIVLIEDGVRFVRSDAVLRILRRLRRRWAWLAGLLSMLPESLRDALYRWVAANRYRWFGQRNVCSIPPPGYAERFLENGVPGSLARTTAER